MGKPTGFMEWQRRMPLKRPKTERIGDYSEFLGVRPNEVSRQQGGRCMDCGVPFCQQGCPLGNMIPDWNDLVFRNRWRAAWRRLASTNNFPEFTGRLCPAPCEAACVLAIDQPAVTIEQIEKEIIERAFKEGWVVPRPPATRTGKRVVVVGSGPAGLAAAQQLNRVGHEVLVIEKDDRIGGLLRYGIPDFKMEKWVIDRRLEILRAEGIRFETGVEAGVTPGYTWTELKDQYDAVCLAIGAMKPRDLDVPGRDLDGVHLAMTYLTQQNKRVAGDDEAAIGPEISAEGKQVVILGGGDTGSDCYGTALRQGASRVLNIELMERPPMTRSEDNPWPQWPMVFRTSSSHQEGGERDFGLLTKRLEGEGGKLTKLHVVRCTAGPNAEGRFEIRETPGSEMEIDCDLLILAMGFLSPVTDSLVEQLGVELDRRGNVAVDDDYRTSVEGVYAAGDAKRGASLIVWAIAEGREMARTIDGDLREAPSPLPTRGLDQHFGGR